MRAARGQVFANADKQSEETGDVPFLTEFGATDDLDDDRAGSSALADAPHDLVAVLALLRLRRPDDGGPRRVQAIVVDAIGAAARRQRQPREAAGCSPARTRGPSPGPRASFGFDPATRALRARLLDRSAPSGERLGARPRSAVFTAADPVPRRLPGRGQRRPRRLGARRPGAEARAPHASAATVRVAVEPALVRRQVRVPVAERAERAPELALRTPRRRATRRSRARRAPRSSGSGSGSRRASARARGRAAPRASFSVSSAPLAHDDDAARLDDRDLLDDPLDALAGRQRRVGDRALHAQRPVDGERVDPEPLEALHQRVARSGRRRRRPPRSPPRSART